MAIASKVSVRVLGFAAFIGVILLNACLLADDGQATLAELIESAPTENAAPENAAPENASAESEEDDDESEKPSEAKSEPQQQPTPRQSTIAEFGADIGTRQILPTLSGVSLDLADVVSLTLANSRRVKVLRIIPAEQKQARKHRVRSLSIGVLL